jgi:hypothetical protein
MPTTSHLPRDRRNHPVLPALVGDLDLSLAQLAAHPEAKRLQSLIELLTNAEYWLSYEPDAFDQAVLKSPSPLRELGIGIALKFGHSVGGELARCDLEICRTQLSQELPPEFFEGIEQGIMSLIRLVEINTQLDEITDEGYRVYEFTNTLSVHALRASGRATIKLDGRFVTGTQSDVKIGQSIKLSALDENARPIKLPEINDKVGGSIYARDHLLDRRASLDPLAASPDQEYREYIFTVPGLYRVSVPSCAEGGLKLFVS